MTYRTRMCRWLVAASLFVPVSLFAAIPVKSIVIFGDSLSDNGNTTHLLKSLRQEESPAYLVNPLKVFVINKMTEFAEDYYVPQMVLDSGIEMVTEFFDTELAPILASLISKVRKVPILPGAPYWQAHFTNGRVWVEYLAPQLGIDRDDARYYTNQAFGGSWASTYDYQLTVWNLIRHPLATVKTLVVGKLVPPSLGLTIQAYLMINPQLDEEAIYFVFTGGNDYLSMLNFEDNYNPAIMSTYVDNVIDNLGAAIHKLTKAGAKHVIVIGLPRIGDAPRYVKTMDRNVINTAVELHNARLIAKVNALKEQMPTVDFLFVDIEPLLQKVINNPATYGFSNVTDACIDVKLPLYHLLTNSPFAGNPVLRYAQMLQYHDPQFAANEKNYHVCDNPKDYLFWDEVHPTTQAHSYLADEICSAMKVHGYKVTCNSPAKM